MARPLQDPSGQLHSHGVASPNEGGQVSFPRAQEDFHTDPRISYSKLENKWILEDNSSEWEYDETAQRWIPSLDEALLEQQRKAYAVQGVDEDEPAQPNNKRKLGDDGKPSSKKQKPSKDKPERKNTAVYVTSLPLDVDADEVNRVFSRCGVISEEIDSGRPRIKLYTDDAGKFKGDALIVYFRPESVALAIQMLDDSDFRFGEDGPAGKMRVKEADWSYKKTKENQEEGNNGAGAASADGKGGDKPQQRKGGISQEQKKVIRKMEKMKAKLADWSDDEDPQTLTQTSSRFDKVVVLKHMFTQAELDEDPAAMLDIKEDIREECSKLGEVTNVVLFDKEQEGVVTVRFANNIAAQECVKLMDGRSFAGQKVEAYISDGTERFKKNKEKRAADADGKDASDDDDEGKRMDEFGNWLETEQGAVADDSEAKP